MNRGVVLFPLSAVHETDPAKCGFAFDLDVRLIRTCGFALHFREHDLQDLLYHMG